MGGFLNRVKKLVDISQEFSIPLIFGVVAALLVANSDNDLYKKLVDYHLFGEDATVFGHKVTAHFLINYVFMVFFFGIATKEITESALPGGSLNPVQKAINPLFGTIGGVVGPAGFYFLLAWIFYGGTDSFSEVANGWAIPTATDIALAWLVARLVFGKGHAAVNFLLLLAVADDAIGLGIIAVFYPDPDHPVMPAWLLLTVGGMAVAYAMRRLRVGSWVPYVAIGGVMSWVGLIKASIEPALALCVIVPFLPVLGSVGRAASSSEANHVNGEAGEGDHIGGPDAHRQGPLGQFEHQLKLFVDMGLFFFAFANAGVAFSKFNEVTLIVLLSLIIGKTIGITLFSEAATKFGFPLPTGMRVTHLAVAALVAGLGLTVALFLAGKAFDGPPFQEPARMGAVLSGVVALLAFAAGSVFKVKDGGQASPAAATKSE